MVPSGKGEMKEKRKHHRPLLCSRLWTCGGHISNGGVHGDVSRSTYYSHRSQALKFLRRAENEKSHSISTRVGSKRKEIEGIDEKLGK